MADFKASAIIVAGGQGTRMGRPKQLIDICGLPCVVRSVKAFSQSKNITEIIVVSGPDVLAEVKKYFPQIKTAAPGESRINSVINGFKQAGAADVIAVHDGARPLVNPADIDNVLNAAFTHGAALLAVPVKDTIKQVKDGVIVSTPQRSALYQAQTPQCYKKEFLAAALEKYGNITDATDEAQLVEKLGVKVHIVNSDYKNIKITTPEDLACAQAFLGGETKMQKNIITRTGLGFDLHRLEAGRPLYIGGLKIEHDKGFLGHSDGDVALHTICDAALGAVCAGEIGVYFPPTDAKIKGISSIDIAKKVLEVIKERNAKIVHIDATIITEEPKMKPHYQAIRESLNNIFQIGLENISFKSKSHEKVGEIGAGNAAMCQAVVTVEIEK